MMMLMEMMMMMMMMMMLMVMRTMMMLDLGKKPIHHIQVESLCHSVSVLP